MILNQIHLLFFQSGVYDHVVAKRCFSNVCARGNLPGRREFTRLNSTRRVGPSRGERKRISPWAIYLSTKASLSPFGMARKKQGACLCLLLDQKRLFSTEQTKIHLGWEKFGWSVWRVTSPIRPWEWRQVALAPAPHIVRRRGTAKQGPPRLNEIQRERACKINTFICKGSLGDVCVCVTHAHTEPDQNTKFNN